MRTLISILLFLCLAIGSKAQEVRTYDLVKLSDGKVIKGEIILFDGTDGDLTIVDPAGRKFFLTSDDYEYFVEDQAYRVRNRDTVIVKERRTEGWQASVGTSIALFNWRPNLKEDETFVDAPDVVSDIPISIKAGIGQYRGREHYIGALVEVGLLMESFNYLNAGLRYQHQYDGYKRNVAFYIPIDLYYNFWNSNTNYSIGNPSFPGLTDHLDLFTEAHSLGIGFGHGFGFSLANQKSISLELGLFKNFVMSEDVTSVEDKKPNQDLQIDGFKFALTYHL